MASLQEIIGGSPMAAPPVAEVPIPELKPQARNVPTSQPAPSPLRAILAGGQPQAEMPAPASVPAPAAQAASTPLADILGLTPEQKQQAAMHRQAMMLQGQMKEQLVAKARMQIGPERLQEMGALERGLRSGVIGLKEFGQGMKALGGAVFADDEAAEEATQAIMKLQVEREVLAPKYDRVEDLYAKGSLTDFLEWSAFNLGEQIPNMATIVAGGGLGGIVGRKVGQLQAAKVIDDIAARKLTQRFTEKGAKAGAFLASSGIETAGTAEEQLLATGKVNPVVAVGAGLLKGGLEIAAPLAVAQRFGMGENLSNKFVTQLVNKLTKGGVTRRTASGALVLAAGEGATEGLQETIDIAARRFVDENYDVLGPEARSRILNSVAVGALLGGVVGAPVSALAGQPREPSKALSPEEIQQILQPTQEFQQPGGFITVAQDQQTVGLQEDGTPGFTEFKQGLDAELERKPGGRLMQVDVAQLPAGMVSATLETLPSSWDRTSAPGTVSGPPEAIVKAQQAQKLFQQAKERELTASQGKREGVQQQRGAKNTQERAQALYKEALAEGFRYMPEGGIQQLASEGIVVLGEVPAQAMREVPETGYTVEPMQIYRVHYKPGLNIQEGSPSDRGTSLGAWVSRQDLRPDQITVTAGNTPVHPNEIDPQKVNFAPGVSEQKQVELLQRFEKFIEDKPNKTPFAKNYDYRALIAEGFRYAPGQERDAALFVGLKLTQIRARPAQLEGTGDFWETAGAFSETPETVIKKYLGSLPGYKWENHKPGTVQGLITPGLTEIHKRNFGKATATLEALLKQMMPNVHILLDARVDAPSYKRGSMALDVSKDFAYIYLHPKDILNAPETAFTLFHEFGHIVAYKALREASVKERSAIFASWMRHLQAQTKQTGSEFTLAFMQPMRLMIDRTFMGEFGQQNVAEAMTMVPGFQNWYGFHEWFAEQTARWATSEQSKPAGIVEKFFNGLFQKMRKVIQVIRLKFPGVDFEPDAAMRNFLDRIYEQGAQGGPAQLLVGSYLEPLDGGLPMASQAHGAQVQQALSQLGVPTPRGLRQEVDKYAWYVRWGWNLVQIAQKNLHIKGLQQYLERTRAWHIEKMRWISRGQERVVEWRNLGKEMSQRLSSFIWEIESMQYLRKGENARQPTMQELQAIAIKHKLNREGLDLFLKIRKDFDSVLNKIEVTWLLHAASTITDPIQQAAALKQVRDEMHRLRQKPYFPHSRFGDWAVAVRDGNDKLIEFQQFENERAQQAAVRELQASYGHAFTVQATRIPAQVKMYRGMPPLMLAQMQEQMQARGGLTKEQREWLEMFQFEMSPANSFTKHLKRRKGTPGWHQDALRGYANYMFHAAHHLARMEYRPSLELAIQEVLQSSRGMPDANKRVQIADYLGRHLDYILYPPNEWTGIRSFAFTWLLGFAPDSALINMSQIPLVAAPYLASRFGDASAIGGLMRSTKDLRAFYQMKAKLSPDELAAYDLAIKQGFVDESFAAELAGHAHGGNLARMVGGTQLERTMTGIGRAAAFMFQTMEKVNRTIVFSAAYRMGRDNFRSQRPETQRYVVELLQANQELYQSLLVQGWTEANATGFLVGRDAVERSQFEYAQWARPEFMRGKKAAMFTFFMFLQNSMWFARYSPGNKRYLAMLLAATGLMGFPLAEDLNAIIKALVTKLSGNLFDPEVELRRLLAGVMDNPDLVVHGFGRESFGLVLLGDALGIPVPGFDFSSRLGFGRLIPGLLPALEVGSDWDTRVARTFEEVIGASYAIPYGLVEGVAGFEPDNFKTYERMMPRAFKNVSRAARWLTEGEETTSTGSVVRKFDPQDPLSLLEAIGGSLGLMPTELRRQWDRIGAESEASRYWQAQRAVIFDQFYRAVRTKDREAIADMRDVIRKFNQDAPPGLQVSADALMQSIRGRMQAKQKQELGLPQQRNLTGVVRRVQEAYPEAPPPGR